MAKEHIERYRKKPVTVEAIQFTRSNFRVVSEFTGGKAGCLMIERCPDGRCYCIVETLEGNMEANEGDYIIKGVHGEFYPCKPDIFAKTYELESTAADVVEVKHGRWVGTADGYGDGEMVYDQWECSECGYDADGADEKPNWNYCPNCGAKMDISAKI